MATIEKIERELNDAKTRLDEATKKLEKLDELKKNLRNLKREIRREKDKEKKEILEEDSKDLEEEINELEELKKDKNDWKEQVKYLQCALVEFGRGEEGVEENKGIKRKIEGEDTWAQAKIQKTKIEQMKAPSTYSKTYEYDPDAMCNYRPNGSKIPISIIHHIFGNFKSKLSAKEINIRDYKISGEGGVIEYLERLAKVYNIEDKRKKIFQDMMHDILGYEMNSFSITNGCTADGAILYTVGGGQRALLILEEKNELGMGGGDPHRQACGSYGKYIPMVPDCERYLNPCFLLHLAGPWLGISGAVFGEEIIIEPLTPMIPLVPILCHHDHLINILVMFDALKAGLAELKTYYDSVQPDQLDIERQSHFPYPRSFKSHDNQDYQFIYKRQLHESKLLFLIEEVQKDNMEDKTPKQWVVKFVQNNYGQEVHEYCYQKKIAPSLFAVKDLYDNWKMIVMEYLPSDKFENLDSYILNLKHNEKDKKEKIMKKVVEAVETLHQENYVHGDLRLINIMISTTNLDEFELKIVDFDWSGKDSNVKYPLLINSEVPWHQDVIGRAPIKKEHDVCLLKNSFKSIGFELIF